jgi:nucleoside 2-deoxyribosyltransferase
MITVYLTGPLYRGNAEDLHNFEKAVELIEAAGKGKYTVRSVHQIGEGLSPEELADKDYLFKQRLQMIFSADLFIALDNFEQDCLCKAEVNYLRAAGYQVMTMSKLLADAELRPVATGA